MESWLFVAVEGPQRPPYTTIHQSARPTFSVGPNTQGAAMGIGILIECRRRAATRGSWLG